MEREPGSSVVEAGPDPIVGAGEQDTRPLGVLPDHVDEREGRLGDPAADPFPALAEIPGAEDVRAEVAGLMPAHRRVGRFRIVVGRFDELDPTVLVEPRYVPAPVEPGLASVGRHVDLPVHASGPELTGPDGRLRECEEDRTVKGVQVVHGDAAGVLLAGLVVGGEIGADGGPRLAAIAALVHELTSDPGRSRLVAREDHRKVPVPADFQVRGRPAVPGFRPHPHVADVAGAVVVHLQPTVVAAGPDDVVVVGFRGSPTALTAADPLPEPERDPAAARAARPPVGVAVLAVSVDPVGDPVIDRDVVHLGDRRNHPAPAFPAILGDAAAAIVADQDALRHPGIHPDVVVVAAGAVRRLDQGAAPIHRGAEEHRGEVDAVGVRRVHREPDVVGSAFGEVVVGHHEPPGVAAVIGTVEAGTLVLDEGVPAVGVARRDPHGDLADGVPLSPRQSPAPARELPAPASAALLVRFRAGEPFPRIAAVSRAVHAASRAAALEAAGVDLELPHPGEQPLGVAEVHRQVGTAGVLVHVKDQLPVRPAVPGAIDAALRLRRVGVAERAGVHQIRIFRMDQDAGDASGGLEAPMMEGAAGVGGAVDAVPHGERRADDEGFPGAGPHVAGVRGGDGQGADRGRILVVEDRLPVDPAVAALPDAARSRPEVDDIGVAPLAGGGAQPVPVGADGAPFEPSEEGGVDRDRLRGGGSREGQEESRNQTKGETGGESVRHVEGGTLAPR